MEFRNRFLTARRVKFYNNFPVGREGEKKKSLLNFKRGDDQFRIGSNML